jgi:hypothetical protein
MDGHRDGSLVRAFSTRREPMAFPNIATAADDVNSVNIDNRRRKDKALRDKAFFQTAGAHETRARRGAKGSREKELRR